MSRLPVLLCYCKIGNEDVYIYIYIYIFNEVWILKEMEAQSINLTNTSKNKDWISKHQ